MTQSRLDPATSPGVPAVPAGAPTALGDSPLRRRSNLLHIRRAGLLHIARKSLTHLFSILTIYHNMPYGNPRQLGNAM